MSDLGYIKTHMIGIIIIVSKDGAVCNHPLHFYLWKTFSFQSVHI